ncbi:MAG: phage/plasmid primase, P4 family [Haloplanus sp.]
MPDVQPENIPDELKERDQWLLYDTRADRPRQPHWGGDFSISWSDPDDWHSFDEAVELAEQREEWGIGYVTAAENDDYVRGLYGVIDLDGCATEEHGKPKEWLPDLEPLVGEDGAYVEWSPSATGLHIPVVGIDVPDWWSDQHFSDEEHEGVEVLANRFCTFTGDEEIPGEVLEYGEHVDEWLADAYEVLNDEPAPPRRDEPAGGSRGSSSATSRSYDDELTEEQVREALSHVPGDQSYHDWIRMVYAAHAWDDTTHGKRVFEDWARTNSKFDDDSQRDIDWIWENADPGGEVGVGTLVHYAQKHGWEPWDGDDEPLSVAEAIARYSDQYDDPDEVPEDVLEAGADGREELGVPDPRDDEHEQPDAGTRQAATDGSGAAASAGPDEAGPQVFEKPSTEHVKFLLGLDESDGETFDDYTDRKKAAAVWQSIRQSDEVHFRIQEEGKHSSLWHYDDGIYRPGGENKLQHYARQCLGPMYYGNNVLTELKAQVYATPTIKEKPDEFGLSAGEIAVENGVVDLRKAYDGEGAQACRDLEPDDLARTRLPVEFDPDADSEHFRPFVEEVVEDGRVKAVQEYIGYCLHRSEMPYHKALMLVGSGANGKSTLLNVVHALLGEDVSAKELHKFDEDNHVAELQGKLANINGDLSSSSLTPRAVGKFKKLTGGDRVTGRHLYEESFEFRPAAKHIYAANTVPDVSTVVDDHDRAFWRRWILVQFPNYYPPGSDRRDPHLTDKITGGAGYDGEMSAVLNWAIEGWGRLMDQGEFTGVPKDPEAVRREWQRWGESVDEFIAECLETNDDPDAPNLTTGEAHDLYKRWCRQHEKDVTSQRAFTDKLKACDKDLGYARRVRTDRHSPTHGYKRFGVTDESGLDIQAVLEDDSAAETDAAQAQLDDTPEDSDDGAESDEADDKAERVRQELVRAHADRDSSEVPVDDLLTMVVHRADVEREVAEDALESAARDGRLIVEGDVVLRG